MLVMVIRDVVGFCSLKLLVGLLHLFGVTSTFGYQLEVNQSIRQDTDGIQANQ